MTSSGPSSKIRLRRRSALFPIQRLTLATGRQHENPAINLWQLWIAGNLVSKFWTVIFAPVPLAEKTAITIDAGQPVFEVKRKCALDHLSQLDVPIRASLAIATKARNTFQPLTLSSIVRKTAPRPRTRSHPRPSRFFKPLFADSIPERAVYRSRNTKDRRTVELHCLHHALRLSR